MNPTGGNAFDESRNNVRCWGKNNKGQLGYEHTNHLGNDFGEMNHLQPVNLAFGTYLMKTQTLS